MGYRTPATSDTFVDAQGHCYIAGQEVHETVWERYAWTWNLVERYESALETIIGPSDSGPFIASYRAAGGGYEGLQAIARAAITNAEGED